MKNKVLLTIVCLLLTGTMGFAQAKRAQRPKAGHKGALQTCSDFYQSLLADGLSMGDSGYLSANFTNYYWQGFLADHSYSAEVWDPYSDANNGGYPSLALLQGCASGPSYTDVYAMDPELGEGFTDRISWISAATSTYQIAVTNNDSANGYNFFLRITDTTLHNPRWSTYSGFITQYAFVNTINQDISGVLTVTESTGAKHPLNITVPAGTEKLIIVGATSGDVVVGANKFGFADFAFVGPPGGILGDAFFLNGSATVVVPSSFAPRNYQH